MGTTVATNANDGMFDSLLAVFAAVHPHPLVASATILVGLLIGLALALSDWKSKFTIGSIVAAGGSGVASFTGEKFAVVRQFIEGTFLLTPLLLALNLALVMFLGSLLCGTAVIFTVGYVSAHRRNDPEAFVRASRRAFAVFGGGLYGYITAPPELAAANRIRELEEHKDFLALLNKTLVREVAGSLRSVQHFNDSIEAIGRTLLRHVFGDGPDLQRYRMAFFTLKNDRLEYMLAINNHDWTSHSMVGFEVSECFMGQALKADRPMVYPRDRKRRAPYVERKGSRYKSFVALPIPCGLGATRHVGVVTIDYTGSHEVFTDLRTEALFAFGQLLCTFYQLNVQGGTHV